MKPLQNRTATLLTKHKKENVIRPCLENQTGCIVIARDDFNTDLLGTFTLEISRPGTQLDTARIKASKAIEISGADLGLASEGSFGPYPSFPLISFNRELVIMVDRYNNMETIGESVSLETNLDQRNVRSLDDAFDFAIKVGFPDHYLIANSAGSDIKLIKDINSWQALEVAIALGINNSPYKEVVLQTDMRAHANPTRMKNILKATEDLAKNILNTCPHCGMYGFSISSFKRGVPCKWCKGPTDMIMAKIYMCQKCKHSVEVSIESGYADPGMCDFCNP